MSRSPVWTARTGAMDPEMQAYSASVQEDAVFLPYDVQGSIAHVQGLARVGLLEPAEAVLLVQGLRDALRRHQEGAWVLDAALEDGHMNLEAYLTENLGAVGQKVHTGRSRNDQVATAVVLCARDLLAEALDATLAIAAALMSQAAAHAKTPWVARTHGQPAQPASLGFLLAAHAARFHDVAGAIYATFDRIGESPLGCGAVAGSTLPLDPVYTAGLLGLRPPRNALLATGTRDAVRHTLAAIDDVAHASAALAEELLVLFAEGSLRGPAAFTTGSSLMPHKRNPDALELVRGHSNAVGGHRSAIDQVLRGLPLGYHRDFQVVKAQLAAVGGFPATLRMAARAIEGAVFDGAVLGGQALASGLGATDAVEALVAEGMPFRQAYTILAEVFHDVEAGADIEQALTQRLPQDQVQACLAALVPDADRRRTRGAPGTLSAMHLCLEAEQCRLEDKAAAVDASIAIPRSLLAPPSDDRALEEALP